MSLDLPPPDDWIALRAIYGIFDDDDDDDFDDDGHQQQQQQQQQQANVRFVTNKNKKLWLIEEEEEEDPDTMTTATTSTAKRRRRRYSFRGKLFITAAGAAAASSVSDEGGGGSSSSGQNVSFVRRVNSTTGDYRYFQLQRLPSVKVEFCYSCNEEEDGNDGEIGPESVNIEWEYYPIEWPTHYNNYGNGKNDDDHHDSKVKNKKVINYKDEFLRHLQSTCNSLLEETEHRTAFSVCEFLEHDLISSYASAGKRYADTEDAYTNDDSGVRYWSFLRLPSLSEAPFHRSNDKSSNDVIDDDENDNDDYDHDHDHGRYYYYNPNGYRIIILPPCHDMMYHENYGTLINPRKEAQIISRAKRRSNILSVSMSKKKKEREPNNNKISKHNKKRHSPLAVPLYAHCKKDDLLDFTRLALIECWKQLYTTSCPICLEDNLLYDEGITFKKCQHYCCYDCFRMYLKHKVADLSNHRTNPFLCPMESCTDRELPFATICRRYLGPKEQEEVARWYRDLTFPPCWSLDRCLNIKECGAVGSMRRKPMPPKNQTKINHKYDETTHSFQRDTEGQPYNYYGETHGPLVDAAGFFHHGVTPVNMEIQRRKADEQKIQDEIKRRTQVNALSTSASSLITCDQCKKTWCELCLHRVEDGQEHEHYDRRGKNSNGSSPSTKTNRCDPQTALKFCRQYLSASDEEQEEIQSKYPWIVSYAMFCEHDGAAVEYLQESGGQRCPNCRTGVERSEGCFHIKCLSCATHFCYECGDELFPPYYGTHHCWEEKGGEETARGERQNRQDEEFAIRLMLQEALGDEAPDFDL